MTSRMRHQKAVDAVEAILHDFDTTFHDETYWAILIVNKVLEIWHVSDTAPGKDPLSVARSGDFS